MAAKTKKPTRRKAPTKKPAARKPKAAAPRKAATKPRPKRAAKPKRPKPAAAIVEAPPLLVPEEIPEVAETEDTSGPARKPGPLARLKSGVGNLFAKMTGRGKRRAPSESDGVPDDVTMDIHTGDILAAEPAPKKQRRKPPPPPGD
jgi:hypothetical protein